MIVGKFRRKPLVVEAVQWDGTPGRAKEIADWVNGLSGDAQYIAVDELIDSISVRTIHGDYAFVRDLDWLVRGPAGDFWPVNPAVFEQSYTSVGRG